MCRISITAGKPIRYMTSGGIKTHEEVINGKHLVHEWLPIQTDPKVVKDPFIRWNTTWDLIGESEKYEEKTHILFNGELFGHNKSDDMELIRSLKDFPSLYEYLSSEADGFWSMILYKEADIASEEDIIAIVDPLSKKQLYYKEGFGISSELKVLASDDEELDPLFFSSTIKWGYVTDNSTPFKNIKRIMPNTYMVFDKNFRVRHVHDNYRDMSPKLLTDEEFYSKMQLSVKNRLAGHLPVSLLLSGGLDSSIIRHHLNELGANVQSYCIDNKDDLYYSKLTDPETKTIELSAATKEEALAAMEMPLDLGSMVPQLALMRSVDTTVVLTGDGADEVFGGYSRTKIYDSSYSDVFEELPFYHLVRLDRMASATTKEIRSPFLHLDIVRHGLALPYSERINKVYLKKMYYGKLVSNIISRPKEPLKSNEIREENPFVYRENLVRLWMEKRVENAQSFLENFCSPKSVNIPSLNHYVS